MAGDSTHRVRKVVVEEVRVPSFHAQFDLRENLLIGSANLTSMCPLACPCEGAAHLVTALAALEKHVLIRADWDVHAYARYPVRVGVEVRLHLDVHSCQQISQAGRNR